MYSIVSIQNASQKTITAYVHNYMYVKCGCRACSDMR